MNKGATSTQPDVNKAYWNSRWEKQETGWDMGAPAPAISEYMAQYTDKNASILIPGCGNAHEAEYLYSIGFTNITLLDIAPAAVEHLMAKFAGIPAINVILGNFFDHSGSYDLIIEQTFFCAISPQLRDDYVSKCAELLNENGQIIGVLFNTVFENDGPPFGGNEIEYRSRFEPYFTIAVMAPCYNSILKRENAELFINMRKKTNPSLPQ